MHTVFLSLGGNHDNSIELSKAAISNLQKIAVDDVWCSSYYSSAPWGFEADQDFVNCVCKIKTKLKAVEVLTFIQGIEKDLGRIRVGVGYTSRPIDIDILYYGDQKIETKNLHVPHPRMYDRNFVLVPFNEIWPFWVDPTSKKTISVLLKECKDLSVLAKY